MNILFMINAYTAQGQNARIAKIFESELTKEGCAISYLFHAGTRPEYRKAKKSRQTNLYPFYFCITGDYTAFIERLSGMRKPSFRCLREIAVHPYLFLVALKRKAVEALGIERLKLSGVYQRKLERLCRKNLFDVVIAVSNPFDAPEALSNASISCMKAHYQIDPYAYNDILPEQSRQKRLQQEVAWFQRIEKTIMPPELYAHALRHETGKHIKNPLLLGYPLVRDLKPQIAASAHPSIRLDEDKINVLFLGALNIPIRDPSFLFALFSMMEDADIRLHIVGSRLPNAVAVEAEKASFGKIVFHDYIPQEEAFTLMHDADILLNLGNSEIHQLPSKILDYISLGKPIINIYKKEGCPTLKLMKEYPIALSLLENMDDIGKRAAEVAQFCRRAREENIPFEHISALYEAYTPQFAAERMLQYLSH